ncbi:MAG: hypothetical protein F6K28_46575 [Microcoleus sp. SIO2G3]|nr:hypothetical protein [Microcoleus sp. SIO2G3]
MRWIKRHTGRQNRSIRLQQFIVREKLLEVKHQEKRDRCYCVAPERG